MQARNDSATCYYYQTGSDRHAGMIRRDAGPERQCNLFCAVAYRFAGFVEVSRGSITTLSCAALTVAVGCASAPPLEPQAQQRSAEGLVSFEQVRDPTARPPVADTGQEYVRPRLEEGFTLPSYPDQALAANAPPTEVVVRLVVGADGSVASIRPSPLAGPPTSEWHTLFYDAVRDAIAGWRYDPCQLRDLEDGPDMDGDGSPDYRLVVASTPLPVYLDMRFRFEIVAGAGQVSMGAEDG